MATNKDNVPTAVKEGRKRQNLQYPLENADEYKSRLVFEILEEPPTDLDKSLGFVSKKIKELTDAEEEAKKAEPVKKVNKKLPKKKLSNWNRFGVITTRLSNVHRPVQRTLVGWCLFTHPMLWQSEIL